MNVKLQRFFALTIRLGIYFLANIPVHNLIHNPYTLATVNTVLCLTDLLG